MAINLTKSENYYQKDRREMKKYVPADAVRILDVGCGEGLFSKSLISPSREIWGVEINSNAACNASKVLNKIVEGPIDQVLPLIPEKYFDVIIFNDVLEHMIAPDKLLVDIRNKLHDDGIIVASLPNFRFVQPMYDILVKKDFAYKEDGVLDSSHIRFFTKKNIIKLFEEAEYGILSIEGINRPTSLLAFLFATYLSVVTLRNSFDSLFMQYAVTAKKMNRTA